MPKKTLFLATRNPGKIQELRSMLSDTPELQILAAPDFPSISEPEETGLTFMENARLKAIYYAEKTSFPALADDSGLVIDALSGRPGVHSARYAKTEELRIAKVLTELKNVPGKVRTARFVSAVVLAHDGKVLGEAEGEFEGSIGFEPRGSNGFGYDPIFLPAGGERTLAEYSGDEKNACSHRAKAFLKILPMISEHLLK